MPFHFPRTWARLEAPEERRRLLDKLHELASPDRIVGWFAPLSEPPDGVDGPLRFFFEDHAFDESAIGRSLFDERELAGVLYTMHALGEIHATRKDGDSAYFVAHPGWPRVATIARRTYGVLAEKGLPDWEEFASIPLGRP